MGQCIVKHPYYDIVKEFMAIGTPPFTLGPAGGLITADYPGVPNFRFLVENPGDTAFLLEGPLVDKWCLHRGHIPLPPDAYQDTTTLVFPGVPAPAIVSISPNTALKTDPAFQLTVKGNGFFVDSVVQMNGVDQPTEFLSITELSATITPSSFTFVAGANVLPVTVKLTAALISAAIDFTFTDTLMADEESRSSEKEEREARFAEEKAREEEAAKAAKEKIAAEEKRQSDLLKRAQEFDKEEEKKRAAAKKDEPKKAEPKAEPKKEDPKVGAWNKK